MKLQHWLGGLENLGPVNLEKRVFVQDWERRIFGIHTAMMAESAHLANAVPRYDVASLPTSFKETWTWASLRIGAEGMHPFEYFKYRYYEKWLMGISQFFVDKGYISLGEIALETQTYLQQPSAELPKFPNEAVRAQIVDYLMRGDSPKRLSERPARFAAGERIVVGDPPLAEHTRLPGYLRNKRGVVEEVYDGAFQYFCSTGPDGLGEPMTVYRVGFDASQIWGATFCEPNTKIYADLFETYLHEVDGVIVD